jgi:hypothetical protein
MLPAAQNSFGCIIERYTDPDPPIENPAIFGISGLTHFTSRRGRRFLRLGRGLSEGVSLSSEFTFSTSLSAGDIFRATEVFASVRKRAPKHTNNSDLNGCVSISFTKMDDFYIES